MSGQATALGYARELRTALLDHGVPAVSIELQVGRPSYGGYGGDDWTITAEHMVGVLSHHTVSSYRPESLTPVLALCKVGRLPDIPGPLPNGYGGWDLIYRIMSCGMANHPGYGGPLTVPGGIIPADSGRAWLWGTEYEGGISVADWDRELVCPRNGKKMTHREFQGRANAGILDWKGIDERSHGEHKTWAPDRKVDRLDVTTIAGQQQARYWLDAHRTTTTPQEDTMSEQVVIDALASDRGQALLAAAAGAGVLPRFVEFTKAEKDRDRLAAERDAAILAAIDALPDQQLTKAKVREVVDNALRATARA